MSNAIDYIALQKSKVIQYMIAQILDESRIKNLLPADTVELAIKRGMEYQKNLDEINKPDSEGDRKWMYLQRNCNELPGDYFERQGWHPPKEPPLDETGLPYYGIVRNIPED